LRYLCNSKEQIDEHWYPKDPKQRGFVDLYFDWHDANIGNVNKIVYATFGFIKLPVEEAKAISQKGLQDIEDVFLSQRKFLSSNDKITIADLALTWHLAGLSEGKLLEFSPRLQEYFKNVTEYPGIKESISEYLELRKSWIAKKLAEDNKSV